MATKAVKPKKTPDEIVLGCIVKDLVTGFTGTVINRDENLAGTIQFGVQPMGDGKSMPNAWTIDHHQLEYVSEGISAKATPGKPFKISIGATVRDRIDGMVGVVTRRSLMLNGCNVYTFEELKASTLPKDRLLQDLIHARGEERLEVLKAPVSDWPFAGKEVSGGPSIPTLKAR